MLEQFVNEITNHRLFQKQDKILLAVSGGVDSMVMLHLLHEAGYEIAVAHCNFQLRGKESDADENFVKDQSDRLKIPFYSKRFSTNNYAADNGLSIQMAARELRYQWFSELCEGEGYHRIATAHHLNDSLETTLFNFIRGTGIDGMKGITSLAGNLVRPMLTFTADEIINYAKTNNLKWREDSSNKTEDYSRNFLRHQVIPKLKEINPSIEESFKRTNQRLQGAHALVQVALDELKTKFIQNENGQIKIDKAILSTTPYPETVVWELIKEYGFNFTQCLEMVHASGRTPGKRFLSLNSQLIIDRDCWIISKVSKPLPPTTIHWDDGHASFGHMEMRIAKSSDKKFTRDINTGSFDAEKISFPLVWRKWEAGDTFHPLGMKHSKKLSDFFFFCKVSMADKEIATVIESNGNVIWVVGYRIDDRFKVTDATQSVIHFKIDPHFV